MYILREPTAYLITKAARALQQATGCSFGVHIGIEKNVPVSAIKMNKVEQKFKNIDEMKTFFNI